MKKYMMLFSISILLASCDQVRDQNSANSIQVPKTQLRGDLEMVNQPLFEVVKRLAGLGMINRSSQEMESVLERTYKIKCEPLCTVQRR